MSEMDREVRREMQRAALEQSMLADAQLPGEQDAAKAKQRRRDEAAQYDRNRQGLERLYDGAGPTQSDVDQAQQHGARRRERAANAGLSKAVPKRAKAPAFTEAQKQFLKDA